MSNEYEGFLFPKPKRQKKRKQHGKNVINTKAGVCFLCAMEGDHSIKPTERHHVLYGNGLREIYVLDAGRPCRKKNYRR